MASSIDSIMSKIKKDRDNKGSHGEDAVLHLAEEIYLSEGGILYHSYHLPLDKSLPGNIKKGEDGRFYTEDNASTTEIDVLLVTPYRIFPIEVKTYASRGITLTPSEIKGVRHDGKSPVHQNEMHARHLYSGLCPAIPEGLTDYIVPIVVFVDKCKVSDERSGIEKEYVPVSILNTFKATIRKYNTPLGFLLDLEAIDNRLTNLSKKYERKLPLRRV